METAKVLAIDCGGTFIKAGMVSLKGEILEQSSITTDLQQGMEPVLNNFQKVIEKYKKYISAVGIAYAGPVNPEKGIIMDPPNFPKEWHNLPLVDILYKRTLVPIYLENDANLAALGEYWKGNGQGVDVLVVLTLGTGVGGGIIINGKIWNGATGIAGEIGHIPVATEGPRCGCGNIGCLETFASSTAVVRMAEEMKKSKSSSKLTTLENITGEKVYQIATAGDAMAQSIFVKIGRYLGVALAAVTHILGPRRIIITGGGAGAWNLFEEEMKKTFSQKVFQREREVVEIMPGQLKELSGILGAAYLALEKISAV